MSTDPARSAVVSSCPHCASLPPEAVAAVFRAVGEPLSVERFPLPVCRGSEVLVRIRCATICGSDLHTYLGRRHGPTPSILGHEMVGEIAAIGPDGARDFPGEALALGDRVTWSMVWSCGKCFYCGQGIPSRCEQLMKFGHEAITESYALSGGLAEFCHLPEGTAIFRVPAGLPDIVASPSNCATATVAAVFRKTGPVAGRHVLVVGAGMLGLTACAMAAAGGARSVIAVEPDPVRLEMARAFGATDGIEAGLGEQAMLARILPLTEGRGVDLAVEFSGHPEAVEAALALLRPGGRLLAAGATFPSRPVQLSAEQIVRRSLEIVGVYNYQPHDLGVALDFLAAQHSRFPFEKLVSASFPMARANEAMDFAATGRSPRVAVIP